MFHGPDILQRVMLFIPVLLSLTVHEFAHAWSAYLLGDDTAARQGRLTLNPLSHMDPIGTFLLPLLGIPFGWAKPVPVNPTGFRRSVNMNTGMMITAAAGPLSNLVLAVICSVVYGLGHRWASPWLTDNLAVEYLLRYGVAINVGLAIFNMLPIPPLDGSRLVDGLLPYRFRGQWESVQRFAPLLLLVVIYFGSSLIAGPSQFVLGLLDQLIFRLMA